MKYIVIIFCIFLYACSSLNESKVKSSNYIGVITNIYKDTQNHNTICFDVRVKDGIITIPAEFYPKSWEFAIRGDSIIKKQDELFFTIKKSDGRKLDFYFQ
ncbi:hypothetical protein [Dysgonomonas sp. ZJ279]|uniref:hypothetical protein n=1 Tax=Dysgonomonas sp. ZJ279 TaxID=2709796 RepID=UPI0013EBA0E3|nr:hypothetical protein [Dysgonomonas sp. ZJ279]